MANRRPNRPLKKLPAVALLFAIMIIWSLTPLLQASSVHAAEPVSPYYLAADGAGGTDASAYDPHRQAGHAHGGPEEGGWTVGGVLFYAVRVIYYLALLLAAGFMLWFSGVRRDNAAQRKLMSGWEQAAVRALLLAVLLFVFVHAAKLMEGQEGGAEGWLRLFTGTAIGRSWLALLLLALLGFAVRKLPDPAKAVWALLLAAAESWNGHALASPSNAVSVVLDFVHLVCAALWAGGLALIFAFWVADRKEAGRFAESFSKAALYSLLLLTATGIGVTATLLPGLSSLLYSAWGKLLVGKTVLVLLVYAAGSVLRARARRRELPRGSLLKLDLGLMGGIVLIVGLFTYMTPVPMGEPLAYHKMGDTVHLTVNLTPSAVGKNSAQVKVWLPDELGAPESVKLQLRRGDEERIEVPLETYDDRDYESFEGFTRTSYRAAGILIPDPGDWIAELTVTDKNGRQTVETVPFRNY